MNHSSKLMSVLIVFGGATQSVSAEQKPHIVVQANRILPMATSVGAVTASPGTISFTATDPDLGSVAGNSSATVSWTTTGGQGGQGWNLTARASASSFTNCATVPTSAVRVTCGSVTGGSAPACRPAITLSTAAQQVAHGTESANSNAPYSVTLNFTLADSWSYIARQVPSCTLTLTYTVTAP